MPDSDNVPQNRNDYPQNPPLGQIEPQNEAINDEGNGTDDEETVVNRFLSSFYIPRDVKNRVKLYMLCDQRVWNDRGTGHVACVSSPVLHDATFVVVRLEHNDKNVLESRILADTIYQKQQETLIVWSESDSCDLALSFQDKSGCEDVWEKICQVQGRDPEQHPDFTGNYEDMDDSDGVENNQAYVVQRNTGASISLPLCELGQLAEIEALLSNSYSSALLREKIAVAIESQGYVGKLCDLFHMCEDLENKDALNSFYQVARSLFMLNRKSLLEILLSEKYFKDVVGMLEYDPSEAQPRKHREFLFEKAKFCEVLPIRSEELQQKIHQTYRVQYVQDVCLPAPSLFEENLLSVLNSHLFFNRVDIIGMLKEDRDLLKTLFNQLKDPSTQTERRKQLAMFLREFCTLSSSLQPNVQQGREAFFKTLMENDFLVAVEPCIMSTNAQTRTITVEMFVVIVEFNPQAARDYLLQQSRSYGESKNDQLLMNKLIEHMLTEGDPELTTTQVLRSLLDPDNMIVAQNLKWERQEFLTFFYRRSMHTLCRPLLNNIENNQIKKDDYLNAIKQTTIIDLLCFCFEHHGIHMRNYCINNKLLNRILVLLFSKHHFLALSALRLFRRVVQLKDELYFRYIVKDDVMRSVVDCFKKNGHRYNLLNSALIELFEFIKMEDIKMLIVYFIDNFGSDFDAIDYVSTFKGLRLKYDQMKDREAHTLDESAPVDPLIIEGRHASQWKRERQADEDEEWFNEDDTENTSPPKDELDVGKSGKEEVVVAQLLNEAQSQCVSLEVAPSFSTSSISEGKTDAGARRIFIGPLLPSTLKRKFEGDDADEIFPLTGAVKGTSRIVIKVNTEKRPVSPSPLPSNNSPPGEQEVSSSEATVSQDDAGSAVPATILRNLLSKKPLVEYDESDSDDEESTDSTESGHDSIPSSSSSAASPADSSRLTTNPDDQGDVSSTSSEDHGSCTEEKDKEEVIDTKPTSSDTTRKRAALYSAGMDSGQQASQKSEGETGTAVKRLRLQDDENL